MNKGDRVRLRQTVSMWDPGGCPTALKGSVGTVVYVEDGTENASGSSYVGVRLDDHVSGLEPWDNELVFSDDNSETLECVGYKLEDTVEMLCQGGDGCDDKTTVNPYMVKFTTPMFVEEERVIHYCDDCARLVRVGLPGNLLRGIDGGAA